MPTEPTLIAADAVVPMDPALPRVMRHAGVVVNDGRIAAVGELSDLRRQFGDLPLERERLRGTLLPGFINAHTHLELSYQQREKFDPSSFTKWVSSLMAAYPPADQLEATVRAGFRQGIAESLRAGVTTVADISRHCALTRAELAAIETTPRVVSFGEVVGLGKMRTRLDALLETALAPVPQDHPHFHRLILGVSPHAPYTVEGPSLRKVVSRAYVRHAPVTMHLAETADEAEFLRHLSGPLGRDWDVMAKLDVLDDDIPLFPSGGIGRGGPIRWAQRWGLLVTDCNAVVRNLPVILAHVNYCDDAELDQLAASHISIAYCPRTHAYFRHPPHRYRDMLAAGINVCLATDSRASNPDMSVLKEAQVVVQRDQLDPYAALEMITSRAASALGLGEQIGSLTPGKFADIQLLATEAGEPEALLAEIVNQASAPVRIWIDGAPATMPTT